MDSLVTAEWLAAEMGASDLRIVDATKHLPDTGRDARAEYEAAHIPGAVFMNLEELVDPAAPIENTLPSAEKFASRMQALGLGDGSRIVLYDNSAIKSSARAWFMLRMFGAQNVALLDGGMTKWQADGRPIASGSESLRCRHYTVWQDDAALRCKNAIMANIHSQTEQVIDARGAPRFSGAEQESRPGIASGHIPGACNVPFGQMFNTDGTWKDRDSLAQAFIAAGVNLDRPIITTCGSGVTACCLTFGLHLIGKDDVALYDGSWTEWGADPSLPKELSHTLSA
ncbi:MAG: hypothetical protein RLZZ136_1159 [Pseudomonadota bacterium]|jgi:thiosulfate/3-mercaptopyruvate sulfurtransferase